MEARLAEDGVEWRLGEALVTGPPPNSSFAYVVMVGPLGAGG